MIFRVNKQKNYVVMSNHHLLEQKDLSLEAKGLLSEMLALPDTWKFNIRGLLNFSNNGIHSTKSALKELQDKGFVKINKVNHNGKFEYLWDIYERPIMESPKMEGPKMEGPKSTPNKYLLNTNTNIVNTKDIVVLPYQEIIDYLNQKANKHFRVVEKTKSFINARFKEGFKLEDFEKVIDNMCSKWIKDTNMSQYLRPETLFGNKFDGYLNLVAKKENIPSWYKDYKKNRGKEDKREDKKEESIKEIEDFFKPLD